MDSGIGCPQAGHWVRGSPVGGPKQLPVPQVGFAAFFFPLKVIFWGWVKTCSLPWASVFLGPAPPRLAWRPVWWLVGPLSSLTESRPVAGCPAQGLPGIRNGHLGREVGWGLLGWECCLLIILSGLLPDCTPSSCVLHHSGTAALKRKGPLTKQN